MLIESSAVITVAASSIGVLFVYSGLAKSLSFQSFAQSLLLIPYFPHRLARAAAFAIPAAEIVGGCGMLLGELWAKVLIVGLLAIFSAVAIASHHNRQNVPCNCFGADPTEHLSLSTVLRNAMLAGVVLSSALFPAVDSSLLSWLYGLIGFCVLLLAKQIAKNRRDLVNALDGALV